MIAETKKPAVVGKYDIRHKLEELDAIKQELFGDDLTADEAGYLLDVDRTTVLRYLRDGRLLGYQLGRAWRIPKQSLGEFRARAIQDARTKVADIASDFDDCPF
jgi:excisionase family DNA binding protein